MRLTAFFAASVLCQAAAFAAPTVDSTDATLDAQLFYPAPGASNYFSVESGDVNSHLGLSVGINVNYARNPLAVRIKSADDTERDVGAVVSNRVDSSLMLAFGIFDIVDLGVVAPLVYSGGFERGKFEGASVNISPADLGFAVGDIRIVPKIRFLHMLEGKLSMALVPTVIVPTGTTDYARENNLVYAPSLAISGRGTMLRGALNLGYRLRDRTKTLTLIVDDEYFAKAALALDLSRGEGAPIEIVGELFGHTPAENPFAINSSGLNKDFQRSRTALEGDIGVRLQIASDYLLMAGVGGGLLPGYGAPAPRVFATLMYYMGKPVEQDTDQDGIVDSADACVDKKEDMDKFEDSDGCPELDNDNDTILDEDDQCLNEPEDKDGFSDEEGCPDPDNDNDTVLDAADNCKTDPEDLDKYQDEDGCPEVDNDNDGIMDADDQCPNEVEDKDGYLDFDGCPEPDNDGDGLVDLNDVCPNFAEDKDGSADDDGCPEENDGDGIPDDKDKCPDKPEVYNGIDDSDGCPEAINVKSLVEVTEEKIVIKETILFATNSAKINPKSFKLLDQVVSVLKNYKHIKKVRIEGHTDNKGNRKKNVKLSKDRAASVMAYLVDKGVEQARLEAEGYGPDKPIASNSTAKGREINRRVEFMIAEQTPIGKDVSADQPAPPPPPTGGPGFEIEIPGGTPPPPPPPGDPGFEIEVPQGTPPPAEEKKKDEKKKDDAGVEFNF